MGGEGVVIGVGDGESDPPDSRDVRRKTGVCGLSGAAAAAASISLEPILRTGVLPPMPPIPDPGAVADRGRCCCCAEGCSGELAIGSSGKLEGTRTKSSYPDTGDGV